MVNEMFVLVILICRMERVLQESITVARRNTETALLTALPQVQHLFVKALGVLYRKKV